MSLCAGRLHLPGGNPAPDISGSLRNDKKSGRTYRGFPVWFNVYADTISAKGRVRIASREGIRKRSSALIRTGQGTVWMPVETSTRRRDRAISRSPIEALQKRPKDHRETRQTEHMREDRSLKPASGLFPLGTAQRRCCRG